jgi:sterol desaturase/sphingolipid hydroxylase (fatty acid hydroxylase superfamily)
MPRILNICFSFLIIDFFLYLNHLLHHKIPVLWKLHRLHHSDKKVDSLTTWLHHPLEIVTTFVILLTLYVMFDLAVIVLVIYGIVFTIHTAFTHFNILVPEQIDKYLRKIIVTPNAHRVHHSLNTKEENSNYGQIFLFWDWLFGTYIYRYNEELKQMNYGIDDTQTPKKTSFYDYLSNPLK